MNSQEPKRDVTNWNDTSLSIFNEGTKAKIIRELPKFIIQPMILPTEAEIKEHLGGATQEQRDECVKWITRFLKDKWVPNDIGMHLLPLRKWACLDRDWQEKGRADVFLVRYKIEDYLIHIVEGTANIIFVAVKTDNNPPLEKEQHVDFVSEIFKLFCKGNLTKIHLAREQSPNFTTGGLASLDYGFIFFTDGKFVRFEIMKRLPGPRMFADPYKPRFSDIREDD